MDSVAQNTKRCIRPDCPDPIRPLSEFKGRSNRCNACIRRLNKQRQGAYRERNKERLANPTEEQKARRRASKEKYRKSLSPEKKKRFADRDKAREQALKLVDPERVNKRGREWRARNKEKVRAMADSWRQRNVEWIKDYRRARYQSRDIEKSASVRRTWTERNRKHLVAYEQRRRAIKNSAGGSWSGRQFADMCQFYGNKCLCCGDAAAKLQADHVVPLSRGGSNSI